MQGISSSNIRFGAWLLMCSFSLAVFSCTPEYLSEQELRAYVVDPENGLTKQLASNGFKIGLTYRPTDLLIAQELGGVTAKDKNELESLRKKYSDYDYFILSLSKNEKEALYQTGGGFGQFSDLVQTLAFRMPAYINMTTSGRDTVEVADFVFPRTFGMGSATNLMFVFSKEDSHDDEWVQFNLSEFGLGVGRQNFRFKTSEIDELPRIDFNIIKENT